MDRVASEWPLMVFTTLAPLCAGTWIVVAALALSGLCPQADMLVGGVYGMVLCALLIISLLCSTLHLGRPTRAFRAFMRLGNSTVSNEVFMGALLALLMALCVIASNTLSIASELWRILLAAVSVLAALFILFQCLSYRMRTVLTWNSLAFSVESAPVALLGGVCVAAMLLCVSLEPPFGLRLALVVIEALC